jgi:hypothetical protein
MPYGLFLAERLLRKVVRTSGAVVLANLWNYRHPIVSSSFESYAAQSFRQTQSSLGYIAHFYDKNPNVQSWPPPIQ